MNRAKSVSLSRKRYRVVSHVFSIASNGECELVLEFGESGESQAIGAASQKRRGLGWRGQGLGTRDDAAPAQEGRNDY